MHHIFYSSLRILCRTILWMSCQFFSSDIYLVMIWLLPIVSIARFQLILYFFIKACEYSYFFTSKKKYRCFFTYFIRFVLVWLIFVAKILRYGYTTRKTYSRYDGL